MNTVIGRVVLGACAFGLAQVAMADGPKARADIDAKDSRIVNILVSLPEGQSTYHCQYRWDIRFKNGAEGADACMADVAPGSKDVTVCSVKYDTRVSQAFILESSCRPAS